MIYILTWTTEKQQNTLSRPLHLKFKKIQGLFKDFAQKLKDFSRKNGFNNFSRTSPKIQGLFKTK